MVNEQPRQLACKQWVRSDYIRSRVAKMVRRGEVGEKDLELLNGLCTAGCSDPVKRGMKAELRRDGILVAFQCGEGERARFGVQSCIYTSERNPRVVQVFHLSEALPATELRGGSVRSILERSLPDWSGMRCAADHNVQDFITKRSHGEESFFIVRQPPKADAGNELVLRYRPDDAARIAEAIGSSGRATFMGSKDERIQFDSCLVNERPGFRMCMVRGTTQRQMVISGGLSGVILERASDDGVYVQGLRSLAKAVSAQPFRPEPRLAHVPTTFLDREMAVRTIRGMGLITGRQIRPGTDFASIAGLLGIEQRPSKVGRGGKLSAHAFSNARHTLQSLGIAEEETRPLMKAGMSDEAICDAVLAARAASQGAAEGLRVLNAPGYTGRLPGTLATRSSWPQAFEFPGCGCEVAVHIAPYQDVRSFLEPCLALAGQKGDDPSSCLVFATKGTAFALQPLGSVRLARLAMMQPDAEKSGEEAWIYDSDVQAAVARLAYITGACRAHPALLGAHEHTLRALWFYTERQRPELQGNVHDICILSCAGKNGSDSLQYSLLPYV
eukprot:148272-Hanusia_phi.AAC.8